MGAGLVEALVQREGAAEPLGDGAQDVGCGGRKGSWWGLRWRRGARLALLSVGE